MYNDDYTTMEFVINILMNVFNKKLVEAEKAKAVLLIEPGFGRHVWRGQPVSVQIAIDGADNQTASVIGGYLMGIQLAATQRLFGLNKVSLIDVKTRFLFNTDLNSRWFIIPGLTVVVVSILSVLLTALTVAREWENGSMELLLSTPVQPLEIIVGKLAPYTILGMGGVFLVYGVARLGFGVPFKGSHVLFLLASMMFLATTLSQGLLISVITRQQQLAMQMANMTGMLPSLLLSGFIYPTEGMPVFFQIKTLP
jgi:ABC-2 type transport system permease protein